MQEGPNGGLQCGKGHVVKVKPRSIVNQGVLKLSLRLDLIDPRSSLRISCYLWPSSPNPRLISYVSLAPILYTKPVLISCSALVAGFGLQSCKQGERERESDQPGLGARKINRAFSFSPWRRKKRRIPSNLSGSCVWWTILTSLKPHVQGSSSWLFLTIHSWDQWWRVFCQR